MADTSGEEEKSRSADMAYCGFSGVSHLQTFDPPPPPPEIYNVDMIGFFTKSPPPPSSMEISNGDFYHHQHAAISGTTTANDTFDSSSPPPWNHHQQPQQQNRLIANDVVDPSLRCVFSCEGNERPSQGLSLSLSSSNPSAIGLQSFELRSNEDLRFGPSSSRSVNYEQPQLMHYSHIKTSRYLGPTQELLHEFCNLGIDKSEPRTKKTSQSEEEEGDVRKQPLYPLDLLELQRRKSKLLQMLDEVERRYRHYCDQMKGVTSAFEAAAGEGAAATYSAVAARAMSRHFRSLRDGIVREIKWTKKEMGEKEIGGGGLKGETPRLRVLDQTLRQQKALQQMSLMENHPWRPQRGLPERSVSVLRAWLFEHFLHPYPSDVDKHILARQTGLSRSQVSNWFINARVRLWKPMVEEMYLEEQKEKDVDQNDAVPNHNYTRYEHDDRKPTHDQLVRIDSECLSSIINHNSHKNDPKKTKMTLQNDLQQQQQQQQQQQFGAYGAVELDFSSYGGGGGGGVSLTLGLGEGGGVSLGYASAPIAATQSTMYYGREQQMEEHCQTVPYSSLLESENQSLQYRNLMGAQLLHDLAG